MDNNNFDSLFDGTYIPKKNITFGVKEKEKEKEVKVNEFKESAIEHSFNLKDFIDENSKRTPDDLFSEDFRSGRLGYFKMFGSYSASEGFNPVGVYKWEKNHWVIFNDFSGKSLVATWLRERPSLKSKLSDRNLTWIYSLAKTDLMMDHTAIISSDSDIGKLDKNSIVFPTINHYIVLKNGEFFVEKPNKDYNLRYVINIDLKPFEHTFNDGKYNPSLESTTNYFNKYICGAFPDISVRSLVQEFVGAAFFKTSFQKCLWLYGNGSNGKSTLLDIIQHVVPGGYKSTDLGQIGGEFNLHPLLGASIIGVPEVEDCKINEARLKSLISGDEIPVNRKGQSILSHRFTAKWFICSNNIPHFNDRTDGFFRRFVWIEVKNKISDKDKDVRIKEKIIGEDMHCFFDWTLLGALRIENRGHIVYDEDYPDEIKKTKAELRFQNNSVAQWLDICGVRVTDNVELYTPRSEIIKKYHDFCSEELHQSGLGPEKFWGELKRQLKTDILNFNKRSKALGKVVPNTNLTFSELRSTQDFNEIEDIPYSKNK